MQNSVVAELSAEGFAPPIGYRARESPAIRATYKGERPMPPVEPGDIIIVPAGVVHGWLDISDHVDYLSFRPSPGILTAGWVHPVLKK